MDKKELILGVAGLLIFLTLVILPGIFSVNIIAHEFYHVLQHRDIAKSLCVDLNSDPFVAHVNVMFANETDMRTYVEMSGNGEEHAAVRFGQMASVLYVALSVFTVFWIAWIVTARVRPERIRRHVRRHVRGLRKRIRRKRHG